MFEKLAEMFPSEEFWQTAVFGAIGGIISVLFLKLLGNIKGAMERGPDDVNESQKRPQEHDERFC